LKHDDARRRRGNIDAVLHVAGEAASISLDDDTPGQMSGTVGQIHPFTGDDPAHHGGMPAFVAGQHHRVRTA
jgi:hypothetical protein